MEIIQHLYEHSTCPQRTLCVTFAGMHSVTINLSCADKLGNGENIRQMDSLHCACDICLASHIHR